jgi:hypothetical protein
MARTGDDRDHLRLAAGVTLERPRGLHVPAIVRVDERRRHQEQDDVGGFELPVDLAAPLVAGFDPAIVPGFDLALPAQQGEVLDELTAQGVVLVGVGDEDLTGLGGHGGFSGRSLPTGSG